MCLLYLCIYDNVRGWIKCSSNPKEGYSLEQSEELKKQIKTFSENYPGKEFTAMMVSKTF